jgi:hypothetical protein
MIARMAMRETKCSAVHEPMRKRRDGALSTTHSCLAGAAL